MGALVNLRQARKAQRRRDADLTAEHNRLAFGRSKAERTLAERERTLADQRLEGHRRDDMT